MYAEEEPQRAADSAFRAAEKKYKKCGTVERALELGALDLHSYDNNDGKMQSESCSVFGRDCFKHSLGGYEGLHIITNALGDKQQVELAHHSLSESLALQTALICIVMIFLRILRASCIPLYGDAMDPN